MDKYNIDGHKLGWHIDRVAEWQKKRSIVPIYIEASPTSLCNHRCIFCGIDFARNEGSFLSTDIFSQRIREMGQLGVRSIMYAGEGEPLLHKDISTLVRVTKESGIDVAIASNGTLGNYEIWSSLIPDLTWIRFSVDAGSADVHAKVHRVSPSIFDKTVKSISEAVRAKRDGGMTATVGVQFLVIDENIDDI